MSIVIIGGNERMVCKYKEICKCHNCKVKVYTHMTSTIKDNIGNTDCIVVFTDTVSHKMATVVKQEAARKNIKLFHSHTSSCSALKKILSCCA